MSESPENKGYAGLLDKSLRIFFSTALRITLRRPSQAYFFFRTVLWQRKAMRVRQEMAAQDVQVPPMVIYSITERCNLHCKGCYAQSLHNLVDPEMSRGKDAADDTGSKRPGGWFYGAGRRRTAGQKRNTRYHRIIQRDDILRFYQRHAD